MITKDIDKIEFEDVVEFLKLGTPEGTFLDYKQDFPSNLEKTIAAMANTFGGHIIIGVKDRGDQPAEPFEGFPGDDGHRQRVTNICVNNITPPVFVEVAVPKNPNGNGNCFVVIRIPESAASPHSIKSSAAFYVRTGQSSNPENIADHERLIWLFDRRQKAGNFKDSLLKMADELSFLYLERNKLSKNGLLNCVAVPHFPSQNLIPYSEMRELIRQCSNRAGDFPNYCQADICTMSGGVFWGRRFDHEFAFDSMHSAGILQHTCSTITLNGTIELTRILSRIGKFAWFALKFFKVVGYSGAIEFVFTLSGLHSRQIQYPEKYLVSGSQSGPLLPAQFEVCRTEYPDKCRDDFECFIRGILHEVLWGMNSKNDSYLNEFAQQLTEPF